MHQKATSTLLSGVLYVAIISAAVILALSIEGPAVEKMQDIAATKQATDFLLNLDDMLQEVVAEGPGSSRIVPVEIKKGNLYIDSENDRIYYVLKTRADMIEPSKKRIIGSLAYESSNTSLIRITEDYSSAGIDIADDMNLYAGAYELVISNGGTRDGNVIVNIKRR